MNNEKVVDAMAEGDRLFQVGQKAWIEFKPDSCVTVLVGETEEEAEPVAQIEPSMFSAIYGAYRQMMLELREVGKDGDY